ncbi:helix-turn-helix transcriptional regulator [Streptomyces sp. NPDC005526]|uniref:helix-turn-helix domain-containing protein n=1 Tax=Streptomyces sp. NPDC005526 TaxID=3156885 RepID=UPI0033B1C2A1
MVLNTLQQMIKRRLDQNGWSYNDVARRGGISRSTVHHLATSRRLAQVPQKSTLEGLAKGLGIPVAPVQRAAAEAAGVNLYFEDSPEITDPEVEILIASVQRLSPKDRRHVAVLVESLLEAGGHEADLS